MDFMDGKLNLYGLEGFYRFHGENGGCFVRTRTMAEGSGICWGRCQLSVAGCKNPEPGKLRTREVKKMGS
jgi:hypothetical protein